MRLPRKKVLSMKFLHLLKIAVVTTSFVFTSAYASLISYDFEGEITRITDEHSFLANEFTIGDDFFGSITYETNALEASTTLSDLTTSIYSSVMAFSVDINGYIIKGGRIGLVQVWDDRVVAPNVVDAFSMSSSIDYTPPNIDMGVGQVVAAAEVNLFDFSHTASSIGTQIPSQVNFNDYESRLFSAIQLNLTTGKAFHLNGVINKFELTQVPEPNTVSILALVFIGLALRRFTNTYSITIR